jgi:hypothetical protein
MKTTYSFYYQCGHCAPALGIISLIAAVVLGGDVKNERKKEPAAAERAKREMEEAAKMVEAIANRNKPPRIVKRQKDLPQQFPLYPKDYDWKEEERVRKALRKLYQDPSTAVWEALVQKAGDRRYCIIFYSGNSGDAEFYSMGNICHGLAYGRLCDVFEEHLPSFPPHGCPIHLEEVGRDLPAWRKARKDKSLYQLQIEVCEMAIRELPKLDAKDLSVKGKAKARKKIEAEIMKLRRTKEPIIEAGSGVIPVYSEDDAKRVREAFEKGSLEDFDLNHNK